MQPTHPYAQVPMPTHMAHLPYDELQFTLVDCPGHASLIRTIIGGAQIIDLMVLVVDVTKGGSWGSHRRTLVFKQGCSAGRALWWPVRNGFAALP